MSQGMFSKCSGIGNEFRSNDMVNVNRSCVTSLKGPRDHATNGCNHAEYSSSVCSSSWSPEVVGTDKYKANHVAAGLSFVLLM